MHNPPSPPLLKKDIATNQSAFREFGVAKSELEALPKPQCEATPVVAPGR